jgi:hypothetical protein
VLRHGPIEKLEANLWVVSGTLPRGPMNRRMSVARLSDGRLVFHNAVPLREAAMRELESFGVPAVLVVPNGLHRLDVHAWKRRYPDITVVAPRESRARVAQVVPVDGGWDALPRDEALEARPLSGSRSGEAAILVRSAGGARVSVLFADTVMNIPHQPGVGGLLLRLIGSSGGPKVTRIARLFTVRDRSSLAADLERLAAVPGLVRVVPTHGDIIAEGAPAALREVARLLRA